MNKKIILILPLIFMFFQNGNAMKSDSRKQKPITVTLPPEDWQTPFKKRKTVRQDYNCKKNLREYKEGSNDLDMQEF